MYMLHTPPPDPAQLRAIWAVFERFYDQGRARALGISNCDVRELRELLSFARVPPAYVQNLFKVYKPGEQVVSGEDVVAFAHANQMAVMGYSVQTEWPHVLPPLQDPHVASLAARLGRTPSQVLHRWALQRGVGVIPKSASRERIAENARLLDFELSEAAMRLLDGLATLSESGAARPAKPAHQEDVYSLSALSSEPPPLSAAAPPSAAAAGDQGSEELLAQTRNRGFLFAAIQQSLLGPAVNLPPGACHEACAAEPACMAWEVCAPYDPKAGCEGCYLVGAVPASMVEVSGWHAAVIRGG